MLQQKSTRGAKLAARRTVAILTVLTVPTLSFAQQMPADHASHPGHPSTAQANASVTDQLTDLRTKVATLESAMNKKQMGMADPSMTGMPPSGSASSASGNAMAGMGSPKPTAAPMAGGMMAMMDMDKKEMPPMGGGMSMPPSTPQAGMGAPGAMSPGAPSAGMSGGGAGMAMDMDKMDMAGMMGMGAMSSVSGATPQSMLPGFPGASHLYHIGATGFFLDHPQHITLTTEQQSALNTAKEQALLAKNTANRSVEQADQELWALTAVDQPDVGKIANKIGDIEKIRGDERLSFIRAVGEASKVLTDDQRKILTGFAAPPPAPMPAMSVPAPAMPAAPAAPAMAAPMNDM